MRPEQKIDISFNDPPSLNNPPVGANIHCWKVTKGGSIQKKKILCLAYNPLPPTSPHSNPDCVSSFVEESKGQVV